MPQVLQTCYDHFAHSSVEGSLEMLLMAIVSIVQKGHRMDVNWTPLDTIENVVDVHLCLMGTMETVCPFNGHAQWTQWVSIASILFAYIGPNHCS